MQLDAKTTWWLTFALVAVQGLNSVAWATLGIDPKWIAAISQGTGYLTLLLTFAIHGSIPGVPAVQMLPPPPARGRDGALTALVLLIGGLGLALLIAAGDAQAQGHDQGRDHGRIVRSAHAARAVPARLLRPAANPLDSLAARIRALSLADFQYAAALAHVTGNKVTAPCWDEWVKLIAAQQQPMTTADGTPLAPPGIHLATDIERLSEFIQQLQPNSEMSIACAPMASAAQKDAATLIGAVLSGGALGLLKLPFALP